MPVTAYTVHNATELNDAIAAIDVSGVASYSITLANSFTLSADMTAINLAAGASLSIIGGGFTIDGASASQGFFVYAGSVTFSNLTVSHMLAQGSNGVRGAYAGGGGGAGLGGGLFIANGATASLDQVTFATNAARGGTGATYIPAAVSGNGGDLGNTGLAACPAVSARVVRAGRAVDWLVVPAASAVVAVAAIPVAVPVASAVAAAAVTAARQGSAASVPAMDQAPRNPMPAAAD